MIECFLMVYVYTFFFLLLMAGIESFIHIFRFCKVQAAPIALDMPVFVLQPGICKTERKKKGFT